MLQRGWLGAGIVLIAAAAGGAWFVLSRPAGEAPEPAASNPLQPGSGAKPRTAPDPLFKGWGAPAFAIMLSGDQHGHIEPCGCSLRQLGGIARRDDLLKQMTARGWPVTAFDVGGLVNRPARRQSQIKFDAMTSALKSMKYAGLALGVEELQTDLQFLLASHNPRELPYLCANIVLFGAPEVGLPVRSTIVQINDRKIGVTAVFGTTLKSAILPPAAAQAADQPRDIEFLDPRGSLAEVLAGFDKESPDLRVLLAHASLAESRELAEAFPQFDVVFSSGGPEDPDPQPAHVGKNLLVSVGAKGKHVGVLGFFPDDAEHRLRWELVDLDDERFKDSEEMRELMRFYQDRLAQENLAAREPAIEQPSGAEFVGAAKCGECHKKAYSKWQTTKHFHGYDSIKTGRESQKAEFISRVHDPECLACHVVGWDPQNVLRYKSGFVDEATNPALRGQQCENCHGPGSAHVAEEETYMKSRKVTDDLLRWRKAQHLVEGTAEKQVCIQCHDADNSPAFKFDKWWLEVKHPWRD